MNIIPKTQMQRKGEIIYDLLAHGKNLILQKDFERALNYNDVTNATAQKDYTTKLIEGNYLVQVEGGFRLTEKSRKEGVITIKVHPSQHTGAVRDRLTAALQQFRPLTTMEMEE